MAAAGKTALREEMRLLLLSVLWCQLVLGSGHAAFAQSDKEQQQKDREVKERIYGTKHPWENTLPYGTQYTPPQSEAGPMQDTKPATPNVGAKSSKVAPSRKRVKATKKSATTKSAVASTGGATPKPAKSARKAQIPKASKVGN